MLIGQSVFVRDATPGKTLYGPWFPREADAATFVLEVMHISTSNCQITVTVQHKEKQEDDAAAVTAGTFSAVTSATTATKNASGLKELVRFKYVVMRLTGTNEWLHFRVNPPLWQPN